MHKLPAFSTKEVNDMNQRNRFVFSILLAALVLTGSSLTKLESVYAAGDVQFQAPAAAKAVNINKAGSEELQTLHGIGPALAERVLQYREEHGKFEKPEDLANVRGIGASKLEKIKSQVSI